MTKKETGLGPAKRFGVRYGRTVKHKFAKIEKEQKAKKECPYCSKQKIRRISYGIWTCEKCNSTFTGRAYTIGKKTNIAQQISQNTAEAPRIKFKTTEEEQR